MSIGFLKYFVRSFLIKFVYRAFSVYSPKSLFKEILLLILSQFQLILGLPALCLGHC
jgi:hypothetical protein